MPYVERHVVNVTTDTDGDAQAFTPEVRGYVHAVRYVRAAADQLASTGTIKVMTEGSELIVLDSVTITTGEPSWMPRAVTHSTAGTIANADLSTDGAPLRDRIPVGFERIKFVVAGGGSAKSGRFDVFVG